MKAIPPRLWRMMIFYVVGPLLQALGSGLAGLVRRLFGRSGGDLEVPLDPPKMKRGPFRKRGD